MTIIIGAMDGKGGILMGCDSAGVNSSTKELQLRLDTKIFINEKYLIGVSGSWRVNQMLRFAGLPTNTCNLPPFDHLVKNFLPFLRRNIPVEEKYELLVGLDGILFHIYQSEQVSQEILSYEAIGSAAQLARAAMYAVDNNLPINTRIEIALEACERFHLDIRRPWRFLQL